MSVPSQPSPSQQFINGLFGPAEGMSNTQRISRLLVVASAAGAVVTIRASPSYFWQLLTLGLASGGSMCFFGFLYGLPATAKDGENPFLQQIADWATKIIVGLGLANLGNMVPALQKMFEYISVTMTAKQVSPPLVGAVMSYFAVVGFFIGFTGTKLFLNAAMAPRDISK